MGRQKGGKPLKRAATKAKAGKRKRRTRAEMAEARKQEAIEQHGIVLTKATRRAGQIKRYNVASTPQKRKPYIPPMGKPKKDEQVPAIIRWLDKHEDDERFETRRDAFLHFQKKICPHERTRIIAQIAIKGVKKFISSCDGCGQIKRGTFKEAS